MVEKGLTPKECLHKDLEASRASIKHVSTWAMGHNLAPLIKTRTHAHEQNDLMS